jgi:hypothetical protein
MLTGTRSSISWANAGPVTDVIRSSVMYFIDPQGRERFLASSVADHIVGGSS